MSYLDAPRVHFFGTFFANPSTINNDLDNFALKPPLDVSWNPEGAALFRFLDCRVSSVVSADGTSLAAAAGDPIAQGTVSTALSPPQVVAKIVDLDPDQQSITQFYGIVVTLALPGGRGAVVGKMAVAELRDLWFQRVPTAQGDGAASGVWQSVLTDLQWSGLEHSAFLRALHGASPDRLSIKFNTDAYADDIQRPTFNEGRLAGTIGPYFASEPTQFVMGRRLVPAANQPYWPAPFQISRAGDRLTIDLGNSMPLAKIGGEVSGPSALSAVILSPQGSIPLPPTIDASRAAYAVNAGVCEIPLTADQARQLEASPLGLVAQGQTALLLNEPADGRYVNVEPFSLRLNPGESGRVTLYASAFGKPLGALDLPIGFDDQPSIPDANTPPGALDFPKSVITDRNGQASIAIVAASPRPLPSRRSFIDSQVYFLGGPWESWGQISANSQATISVLVFNDPPPKDNPTWADVQPVLNQYAVLYPAMKQWVDLSDYQAVSAAADQVLGAITLPIENPAHMPVTRDLSASHRAMIQTWIKNGCPEGASDG
jgi:hypothetical protein